MNIDSNYCNGKDDVVTGNSADAAAMIITDIDTTISDLNSVIVVQNQSNAVNNSIPLELQIEVTTQEQPHSPFNPQDYDLPKDFRLTAFSGFSGLRSSSKLLQMNQAKNLSCGISAYLKKNHISENNPSLYSLGMQPGMDVSMVVLRDSLNIIKNMEVLCPMVDDPYIAGRIACVITLSGLNALGIFQVDNILMLLCVSTKLKPVERSAVIPLMIKGFRDAAREVGTALQGGQTCFNPWNTIGGVATAICSPADFILPVGATVGDILILTKPLGTLQALLAYEVMIENGTRWSNLNAVLTKKDVKKAYQIATRSMNLHNFHAAKLMHKYEACAGAEIGEYGLLGHAKKLLQHQKADVSFHIYNLPIIAKMDKVRTTLVVNCMDKITGITENENDSVDLLNGTLREISGGLLVVIPKKNALAFLKECELEQGFPCWIVGVVQERVDIETRTVVISKNKRVIHV